MADPSTPSRDVPPILALVRDLMFSSRISTTAKNAGAPIQMIRDPQKLQEAAAGLLIVDLNLAGAIDAVKSWKDRTGGQAVGFLSHVDADTAAAARAAGIDRVLARSRFVEILPTMLLERKLP